MAATKLVRTGPWQVLTALALTLPLISAAAASADETGVSPSAILERADATLGSRIVPYGRQSAAAESDRADKTLAPYFYVDGGDAETERLPLTETAADVQIAGVIARVLVHQVFENTGSKPIEAVYVFPGSTRAAVHGMRMRIGERTIEAKIDRKQAARQQYEQARAEGKRASLLEQERPNVFTMRVANVMPRDRIEVELEYSELLVPEDAVYEFVFPTVVGPRYGGGADPTKDTWIANPYLTETKPEPYHFDLKVHLETAIGIKELASPSHDVTVSYVSSNSADVQLRHPGGGNKDFVLRYRLAGDRVETGMLLFEDPRESFFVLMMEPPQRPALSQLPPREYIFLLDVSGSMHGFPIETSKELMRNLLRQLRPSDYFNLVFFSGSSYVLSPAGSLRATPSNIDLAMSRFSNFDGAGGTELMGGLRSAYSLPTLSEDVSRTVVVATDGYVGVEAQAFKFIRDHLDQANLFAFGIGNSVNRALIEAMARAGQGEPFVVLRSELASEQARKLREYIELPVLTNVRFAFEGFDAVEVAPKKLPDLMARRPLILFGKYRGPAAGTVTARGFSGRGPVVQSIAVELHRAKAENAPIRWLWARKWVELLEDELAVSESNEIQEAIARLGLDYNILTQFTSFVAIDSEVVNRGGKAESVKQPLPLPEGVPNSAVGGARVADARRSMRSGVPAQPGSGSGEVENMYIGGGSGMSSAFGSVGLSDTGGVGGLGSRGIGPGGGGLGIQGLHGARRAQSSSDGDDHFRVVVRLAPPGGSGLIDPALLLRSIEAWVRTGATHCLMSAANFKLRLTVDAKGNVVKVAVLAAPDAIRGTCVARAIEGHRSGTRATDRQGTLVVEVLAQ